LQHCDGYGRLLDVTDILASWAPGEHSGASLSGETLNFPTYRKGEGPGVIVIHEIPGLTPKVVAFAEEVVAAGFTVVLPHLFGTPGRPLNPLSFASSFKQGCVNREFTKLARGETSRVVGGLRAAPPPPTTGGEPSIIFRVLLVAAFLLLTTPVAAHAIARAAYRSGEPMETPGAIDESGRLRVEPGRSERSGSDLSEV
jgi:hypothetical protein